MINEDPSWNAHSWKLENRIGNWLWTKSNIGSLFVPIFVFFLLVVVFITVWLPKGMRIMCGTESFYQCLSIIVDDSLTIVVLEILGDIRGRLYQVNRPKLPLHDQYYSPVLIINSNKMVTSFCPNHSNIFYKQYACAGSVPEGLLKDLLRLRCPRTMTKLLLVWSHLERWNRMDKCPRWFCWPFSSLLHPNKKYPCFPPLILLVGREPIN